MSSNPATRANSRPHPLSFVELGARALLDGSNQFFFARRAELVALAARHIDPAIIEWRESAAARGG